MSLETGNHTGPNRESLELLRQLAAGRPADASMKSKVFDERGNLQPDRAVPTKAVLLNNMWMLLPGGPDRDPDSLSGLAAFAGQGTIAQYRLSDWDGNSNPEQIGHSAYLLGLKPAELFKIVDAKLETLGVNIEQLAVDLDQDVRRLVMRQSLERYPHAKHQVLLSQLYPLLRAEGFSHRDLTKHLDSTL